MVRSPIFERMRVISDAELDAIEVRVFHFPFVLAEFFSRIHDGNVLGFELSCARIEQMIVFRNSCLHLLPPAAQVHKLPAGSADAHRGVYTMYVPPGPQTTGRVR